MDVKNPCEPTHVSVAYPSTEWSPQPYAESQFEILDDRIPAAADAPNTGSVSLVKYPAWAWSPQPNAVL